MKKFITLIVAMLLATAALFAQEILPKWEKKPSSEQIIQHDGFTVSYNSKLVNPNWVAWELTPEEASSEVTGRTDVFVPDPELRGRQADTEDYTHNVWHMDRGHMAPSADFKWDKHANEQTFYMTNICPQNHNLNDNLWLELEQRCRTYAKMYNTNVQIVCGPIFSETEQLHFGRHNVRVPTEFFKAVMFEAKGESYAIAFIFPNREFDNTKDIFEFCVPISEMTKRTGLKPFPDKKYKETGKAYPFNIKWKKNKKEKNK